MTEMGKRIDTIDRGAELPTLDRFAALAERLEVGDAKAFAAAFSAATRSELSTHWRAAAQALDSARPWRLEDGEDAEATRRG